MNGWQRFGLLFLGCIAVLILYPNYGTQGLSFVGFVLAAGAGILLVLSVISNLFAIYRFTFLNNLITLGVIAAICYVLLWYFPQADGFSPIEKIKAGHTPTRADIDRGIKQLTFNFDFVHRNVRQDENFSNQETGRSKSSAEKTSVKSNEPKDEALNEIEVFTEGEEE